MTEGVLVSRLAWRPGGRGARAVGEASILRKCANRPF